MTKKGKNTTDFTIELPPQEIDPVEIMMRDQRRRARESKKKESIHPCQKQKLQLKQIKDRKRRVKRAVATKQR